MDSDVIGAVGSYMGIKNANLLTQVQASLLRKTMDQDKQSSKALVESMLPKTPNPPHLGNNVDLYV